jgi:hypothetical protein
VLRSPGFMIGAKTADKTARVWVDDATQVLLHDGAGTNAHVQLQESNITLLDTAGGTVIDEWTEEVRDDVQEPSEFVITLSQDKYAFNNKYFITFNALDKQSGIDHYEVMEEPFSEFYTFVWGRADAPWIISDSPYVLKDQTLNSTIRVKVIDKAGNERIEVLVPDVAQRSMSYDARITTILVTTVSIAVVSLIAYALLMRRRKLLEKMSASTYE